MIHFSQLLHKNREQQTPTQDVSRTVLSIGSLLHVGAKEAFPLAKLLVMMLHYNLTFSGQSPAIKLLRQIMILRSLPYICQFWQLIQYSHDAMMTFNTFQELANITTWLSPIETQQLNSQGKLKLTDLLSHLSVDRMTMLWDDHMAARDHVTLSPNFLQYRHSDQNSRETV